jgi:hypothetical protein
MFDRFSDRARKVLSLAREEAARFGQNYIGTEHVLLGLIKEGSGLASIVFEELDIDTNKLRSDVEKLLAPEPAGIAYRRPSELIHLEVTPRAKKVLDFAIDEARQTKCDYVGTEHILVGLIREGDGLAASVLSKVVDLEKVRAAISTIGDDFAVKHRKEQKQEPKPVQGLLSCKLTTSLSCEAQRVYVTLEADVTLPGLPPFRTLMSTDPKEAPETRVRVINSPVWNTALNTIRIPTRAETDNLKTVPELFSSIKSFVACGWKIMNYTSDFGPALKAEGLI